MANTYLTRTNSSPTNAKKYTWSSWNKIDSNAWMPFFSTTHQGGHSYIGFSASADGFGVIEHGDSAGTLYYVATSASQRDVNGWYHVVVQFDSTQSTASDRVKLYINNELQTNLNQNTYPSQNLDSWFVDATTIELGRRSAGSGQYYSGIISHAHFIDGTVYAPSTFGETDSTTGEWKIKTNPGISTSNYGNNGFWMFKDDNSYNDDSGNGNNFSLGGGTLTKTEDNPSNVFATMNPLHPSLNTDRSFANGNTYVVLGGTARVPEVSTLGMTSGKFYAEAKVTGGTGGNSIFGITGEMHRFNATDYLGTDAYDYSYLGGTGNKINTNNDSSYGATFTTGDIIGIAVDLDNLKIYFSKNGTWQNSGDPTSGATGTGAAFTIASPSSTNDGAYFFACGDDNAYAEQRVAWNFGNGDFSGNTISSAGTNASGNGIFEYDVPTGYTALSTKGLNL